VISFAFEKNWLHIFAVNVVNRTDRENKKIVILRAGIDQDTFKRYTMVGLANRFGCDGIPGWAVSWL